MHILQTDHMWTTNTTDAEPLRRNIHARSMGALAQQFVGEIGNRPANPATSFNSIVDSLIDKSAQKFGNDGPPPFSVTPPPPELVGPDSTSSTEKTGPKDNGGGTQLAIPTFQTSLILDPGMPGPAEKVTPK